MMIDKNYYFKPLQATAQKFPDLRYIFSVDKQVFTCQISEIVYTVP